MTLTWAEWDAEVRWRREQMPIRVTLFLPSTAEAADAYLRSWIRGEFPDVISTVAHIAGIAMQKVILQGSAEADRVIAQMTNLKIKRARPFGGATSERVL